MEPGFRRAHAFRERHIPPMRDTLDITLAHLQTLLLEELPELQALYLFGSHATGQAGPGSDLDLGLLLPHKPVEPLSGKRLFDLRARCEELADCRVDLLDLRRVSTILQIQVLAAKRRLFAGDKVAAAEFEMMTLSFYQRLNEERRGIMERFHQTGRAYS